jgi:hypothetical protein
VDFTKMSDDEKVAWELQKEEHVRYRALHAQYASEMSAKKIGMLAKRQRVTYFHQPTSQHFEAVVVGVHLDDGPDQPYYVSCCYLLKICSISLDYFTRYLTIHMM